MYTAATAATDAATCIVGMSLRIKDVINDSVRIHSLKFLSSIKSYPIQITELYQMSPTIL